MINKLRNVSKEPGPLQSESGALDESFSNQALADRVLRLHEAIRTREALRRVSNGEFRRTP